MSEADSNAPLLSLCLIARDEAERIAGFIDRHRLLAPEILVVDTGSQDATAEIARAHGARVEHFSWCDDFAAARNGSLAKALGDWILVLDADEWIAPADFASVRARCSSDERTTAFRFETRTYSNDSSLIDWRADAAPPAEARGFTGYYPSWKARLFPGDPRIRFSGVIHEMVEPSLESAGIGVGESGVIVHHLPDAALDPERARRKHASYLRLTRKKAAERAGDPKALYELGMIAFEAGLFREAADALGRAAALAPNDEAVAALCAAARIRLGDFAGARHLLLPRMAPFSRSAEIHALLGEAMNNLQDLPGAEEQFLEALALRPAYPHVLILLGNLLMVTDRMEQACACFQQAARINSHNEIAFTNAGIVLAAMGRLDDARAHLERSRELNPALWLSCYYLGQIAEAQGRREDARRLYEEALHVSPNNPRVRHALSRFRS